jgi:DNA invertase Pin-like site-specific DNA recombinase
MQKVLDCDIPEEFRIDDGGYSGTSFDRPSFRRALSWYREGHINAVAFPFVDRFARDMEVGLRLIRMFHEHGLPVILGDLGVFRPNEQNHEQRMRLQMWLMQSEWQRSSILGNTRRGVEMKIRNGQAHGSKSPYGWHFMSAKELIAEAIENGEAPTWTKPPNVHRRIPEHIKCYKLMGDLALQGYGQRAIAREMMARGIKSPGGKTR